MSAARFASMRCEEAHYRFTPSTPAELRDYNLQDLGI